MEVPLPTFGPLEQDARADVCIIGAGIVGLTCAYTLSKMGKSVIVVDEGALAGGQTARTTGHLTWVLDDRYSHLEHLFGTGQAKLAADSHAKAVNYIEKICRDENIECDFERLDGYLFLDPEDSQDILEEEYNAIKKIGMPVDWVSRAPFSTTYDTGRCLQFPNQAQFHVMKYIKGLLTVLTKRGVQIFAHTRVNDIKDGETCIVKTKKATISAQDVIVATCTPVNDRYYIHTKQAAYRTYVIGAAAPKGSIHKALYYDTLDPYHYIRIQNHLSDPNLDWILVGGEDHRTGQDEEEKYSHIETWARERMPSLQKIEFRWSGQIYEPVDSLAFIGKNPHDKHIYIATGDAGNGITHGTIAGMLIPDLIMGNNNPWKALYEPSRKTIKAAGEFILENANTMMQYTDWLTPGEQKTIDDLPRDEGLILREGLKKIAVYKDKEGKVEVMSAICPHLKACLRWNSGEKSWDCPAHGSRFDSCGKSITGPSSSDLK